ncbi:MAG: hypothetical protein H5U01_14175, partial [Clostridia bacterium]|nr:hypothetical protein [Clostridia bacterium]
NPKDQAEPESAEEMMPSEEEGFSPKALDDSGEYDSYDDAMEDDSYDDAMKDDESLTPEEPAAPEDDTTWTIVNPEPIVSSSADSDDGSPSTPLIFDTPWHGEPGENFFWVESDTVPESPATVDQSAESEYMDSSYDWNSGDWDAGSMWDVDMPGYRMSDEAPGVGDNRDGQGDLEDTSDPAGESSQGEAFQGEGQEETPAE